MNQKMMKPFSSNIIFMDTEFSTLDPYKGEILSVGLVKLNGEELYLELEYQGEVNDYVKERIIPTLTAPKVSREEATKRIKEFIGSSMPYMVGYSNAYDVIYWYKLLFLGSLHPGDDPFYWLPIDFASMLFAFGINPEGHNWKHKDSFIQEIGIDYRKYKRHNALDDARLLREVYLKLTKQS